MNNGLPCKIDFMRILIRIVIVIEGSVGTVVVVVAIFIGSNIDRKHLVHVHNMIKGGKLANLLSSTEIIAHGINLVAFIVAELEGISTIILVVGTPIDNTSIPSVGG